jgi:hypothetical protein
MTRQGAKPLTRALLWKGVAPWGYQPRTMSHDSTTHSACTDKRNDTHIRTHPCSAYKIGNVALTSANG